MKSKKKLNLTIDEMWPGWNETKMNMTKINMTTMKCAQDEKILKKKCDQDEMWLG